MALRVLVAFVRGTVDPPRNRFGHCICERCLAYRAEYQRTSPKKRASKRAWLERHPDKSRQYSQAWIEAHPDQRSAIVQSWRDRHPDRVRAMNARAGRRWATTNRGIRNASVKARQMAKRRAMPAWVDRAELVPFYQEAARLTRETGVPHEVDHIYPLQAADSCGLHVPGNLQVLPRSLNRSKRNKPPEGVLSFAS